METPATGHGHAELVVINKRGMALTQSDGYLARSGRPQARVTRVTDGMILADRDSGEMTCFVDRGGIVTSSHGIVAVKSGGTVTAEPSLLFHEPGASIPVSRSVTGRNTIEVPEIRLNRIHQVLQYSHNPNGG